MKIKKNIWGKLIFVSGDFRQLLPVIKKSYCGMIINYTFKRYFFGKLTRQY